MAQPKLEQNMDIIQQAPLEIQLLGEDMNIIAKLDDEPNDVGGLTAAELKAEFDKGGNIIKKYLNETLVPEILASDATEKERIAAETARKKAEEGRVQAETARVQAESLRLSAETARTQAEEERIAAEAARKKAEEGRMQAEVARVQAETSRTDAEAQRAAAEQARVTSEAERGQAELLREAHERTREANELTREQQETTRVAAEDARNSWGDYDPQRAYLTGNKVSYQGSSYLCIAPVQGIAPPDSLYWLLIARRGMDGEGSGDMLSEIYDPTGQRRDIFEALTNLKGAVDEALRALRQEVSTDLSLQTESTAAALLKKQDLLKGTRGQLVGFDPQGKAVAVRPSDTIYSDLELYALGKHPILNCNGLPEMSAEYIRMKVALEAERESRARNISLSGDRETITVYDN